MSEAVAPAQDAASKPAEAAESRSSRPGVIQLAIREKAALQAAYMPFIAGGGLFIPSTRAAELGDQVYIILSLLDDPNKLAITGKVVWLTPQGVPGRQQGVGVQLAADDAGEQARNRIETLIGGARTAKATHTI
ncbi:MAG: PilZ domain-containing protein [Burkholderiaceae bacterium]